MYSYKILMIDCKDFPQFEQSHSILSLERNAVAFVRFVNISCFLAATAFKAELIRFHPHTRMDGEL